MQGFHIAPEQFDVLTVAGPDAIRFLQGQLTCDVDSLAEETTTWGAACNNKGRVHATFLLVKQEARLVLLLARGVGDLFMMAMKKFLPFYKCTLELNPSGWHCLGLAGPDTTNLLEKHFGNLPAALACKTTAEGFICTLDPTPPQYLVCNMNGTTLQDEILKQIPQAPPGAWHALGMLGGHFPFMPQDTERYTVQELHLDRHGYVSFSKGCYTGQEIVARMHYRGKPKKQLYLVESESFNADWLEQGFDVLDSNGTTLGHTLKQACLPGKSGIIGLIQLPVELADSGTALCMTGGATLAARPF